MFDGIPVGNLTAVGLLGIWVLLVMLGKMPTPGQHKETIADRDYWRTSADTWQKVATEQGMTLEKLTATTEQLLTYAESTQHLVSEIQRAGTGEP